MGTAQAQSPDDPRGRNWCGTTAQQESYFAAHPGAREAQDALYKRVAAMTEMQLRIGNAAATPDVTIPVVVHVIHSGGTDNISDRQIESALNLLNLDFQKLDADTATISPLFRPIAANAGFQFRLAKKDPNGSCTTGITRHYAPNLVNDNFSGAVQAVANWDRSRYMNIWVVRTIGTPTAGGFTAELLSSVVVARRGGRPCQELNSSGASRWGTCPCRTRPVTCATASPCATIFLATAAPAAPTTPGCAPPPTKLATTLACCTPGAAPTSPASPATATATTLWATPRPPTALSTATCSTPPCGPIANVQNFMDYASCANMFTTGQKALMRNLLNTSRTSLTTSANLVATGTNDGHVAPECAPVVAFGPAPGSTTSVCVNTPVTLRDYS